MLPFNVLSSVRRSLRVSQLVSWWKYWSPSRVSWLSVPYRLTLSATVSTPRSRTRLRLFCISALLNWLGDRDLRRDFELEKNPLRDVDLCGLLRLDPDLEPRGLEHEPLLDLVLFDLDLETYESNQKANKTYRCECIKMQQNSRKKRSTLENGGNWRDGLNTLQPPLIRSYYSEPRIFEWLTPLSRETSLIFQDFSREMRSETCHNL